jgi:hypothetical protein
MRTAVFPVVGRLRFAGDLEPSFTRHRVEQSLPFARFALAGLLLVIPWAYTLLQLRFSYATWASLTIITGYEIVAIVLQRHPDRPAWPGPGRHHRHPAALQRRTGVLVPARRVRA